MDYGEVVVYITYSDQAAEVIGLWNVAQVNANGKWHIGTEYSGADAIYSLIQKYVDSAPLSNSLD